MSVRKGDRILAGVSESDIRWSDVENGTVVAGKAKADASGNIIADTYAAKTALSGYLPVGGTAAKATADASGNNIVNTYATKTALAGYVTTTGTAAKATADASGNNIVNTYAKKSEYLPLTGGTIVTNTFSPLQINRNNTSATQVALAFLLAGTLLVSIGAKTDGELYAYDASSNEKGKILHTGNSRPVVVSATAPTDTTAVWIVPS